MRETKFELQEHWKDCKLSKLFKEGDKFPSVTTLKVKSDTAYIREECDHIDFVIDATDTLREWFLNAVTKRGGIFDAHLGFDLVANNFAEQALEFLDYDKTIYVKGHSRGGAIALLIGARLRILGFDVVVVSYGAPKVGGTEFIECVNAIGLTCVRVEIRGDIVCKLPFSIWRKWEHYSTQEVLLSAPYAKGLVKHIMYGDSLSDIW